LAHFRYCLNTSTLRGHKLTLIEEIEIASAAGYTGIEPWIDEIDKYVAEGGSLAELKLRFSDAGLAVESAIGFFEWMVDDPDRRAAGLNEARRTMELVAQIGGARIAAPPMGATDYHETDLLKVAERYGVLLDLGREIGVAPLLEVWGFSQSISRLGEAAFVAVECGREDATILADVYHLYKGGSDPSGLLTLNGAKLPLFHMNDYPASIARADINDSDRVFPGDGDAAFGTIVGNLAKIGADCALSLELFNAAYYARDAREVAVEGLTKLDTAVKRALG
jgi:sugar phosphate isomerase/epimerase